MDTLTLPSTHVVAIAAASARKAADQALAAAYAFSSVINTSPSQSETKIKSTSITTTIAPHTSLPNNNTTNTTNMTNTTNTTNTTNKTNTTNTTSSTTRPAPSATLAPRFYDTATINTAAKKLIAKYKATKAQQGLTPNVRWRAVSDAVLELHPQFDALPDPTEIVFQSFADLTKFRQSSWQSEELHKCRVTTRHLLHALGLSSSQRLAQGMSIAKRSIGVNFIKYVRQLLAGQRPTSYGYLCQTTLITRDVVLGRFDENEEIPKTARWTLNNSLDNNDTVHPKYPEYSIMSSRAEPLLGVQICFGKPVVGERLIAYASSAETEVKYWKLVHHAQHHMPDEFCLVGCGRTKNFCAGVEMQVNNNAGGARVIMMEEDITVHNLDKISWHYDSEEGILRHKGTGLLLCIDTVVKRPDPTIIAWTPTSIPLRKEYETNRLTAWTHTLRPQLPEHVSRTQERTVPATFRHANDVAMAWGGVQEATAVLAIINEFPNGRVQEVGCSLLESSPDRIPKEWGIDIGDLPLIGASPDGMLFRADGTKEVVEIKNVCPIVDAPRQGNRRGKGFDIGSNKTPPVQVPASHMPQIQMEMFCTDTLINNYVVVSAFHGVHMFRVERSDQYIRLMLELLRNLELEVVRKLSPSTPLNVSFFEKDKRYEKLRFQSIQLAQKTKLWRQVFPTRVQRGDESTLWLSKDGTISEGTSN